MSRQIPFWEGIPCSHVLWLSVRFNWAKCCPYLCRKMTWLEYLSVIASLPRPRNATAQEYMLQQGNVTLVVSEQVHSKSPVTVEPGQKRTYHEASAVTPSFVSTFLADGASTFSSSSRCLLPLVGLVVALDSAFAGLSLLALSTGFALEPGN